LYPAARAKAMPWNGCGPELQVAAGAPKERKGIAQGEAVGGMSTSREFPDASRDGDVPPTGEALSRGRSGSQALPWPSRYEPFRRKRGAIHLHSRPAPPWNTAE